MAETNFTAITINPYAWQETGPDGPDDEDGYDPRARLLTEITINGLPMHLEAIAVRNHDDEGQIADNADFAREVEAYQNLQDTAFQTTIIDGREYILIATPHGN
jgi:hypothetical protein